MLEALINKEVISMSDNWVVQNLQNSLDTWNSKMTEIWGLLTQSPQNFKGGAIWKVIVNINGTLQAIGLALLVLFFGILSEASMSFLGIGIQPPFASLGSMLSESQNYLRNTPWYALGTGGAIILLILGFSLLSEGLQQRTRKG